MKVVSVCASASVCMHVCACVCVCVHACLCETFFFLHDRGR